MSDQDKPLRAVGCSEPEATAGEHAAAEILQIPVLNEYMIPEMGKIIDAAINAALCGERAKVTNLSALLDACEKQLADERENYALALQMVHIEGRRANEAEKQLAAERSMPMN